MKDNISIGESLVLNNMNKEAQNTLLGSALRSALIGGAINNAGNKWYVSRNVVASGDGTSWETAFKTIGEAIARVNADYTAARFPDKGRNAVIFVGEGWYSEVPLTLTANDCTIIGVASGSHDFIVLYGSATAGGWDAPAGAPALKIEGSNNTIINMGFFVKDPLYATIQIGAHNGDPGGRKTTYNNSIINCNFVRDAFHGSLGGIDEVSAEGSYIIGCRFSTSSLTFGIRIRSNGSNNPVGVRIMDCHFVGTETGIIIIAGSSTIIKGNIFIDDMTDRADTITLPVDNSGGSNTIYIDNYAEFNDAGAITGGDHLHVNNHQLA